MCMKNERNLIMKKLTLIMIIVLAVTTCFSFAAFAEEETTKESGVNWGDDNFAGNLSLVPVNEDLEKYNSYKEKTFNISSNGCLFYVEFGWSI